MVLYIHPFAESVNFTVNLHIEANCKASLGGISARCYLGTIRPKI